MSDFGKIVVVIPAYNPDVKLLSTIDELYNAGFKNLIVVNDGSKEECRPIFASVSEALKTDLGGGIIKA